MITDPAARLDIPALLADLTLEEKASLLDGADFWRTQPVERLGIPGIMVTDGPHGLRKQAVVISAAPSHDPPRMKRC